MKKLLCILLALCLMLTAFAGCNKDEDTKKDETEKTTTETPVAEPEEVTLVGVWKAVMEISEPGTDKIAGYNQTLEFKEDGTVVQTVTKTDFAKFMTQTTMFARGLETEEELRQVMQETLNMTLEDWIDQLWASTEESKTNPMGTWEMDDAGKIIWKSEIYIVEGTPVVFECDGLEGGKPIQFVYNVGDEGTVTVILTK